MPVNTKDEISLDEYLISTKGGFFILVSTVGMEKFDFKNLAIICPDIFIYQSYKMLWQVADYLLNFYTDEKDKVSDYELHISGDYPEVNFRLISLEGKEYYILNSGDILRKKSQEAINQKRKTKNERDIIDKPHLRVIIGGKK